MLLRHRHEDVAMTRLTQKALSLRAVGAEPAVADALDAAAVTQAVRRAEPDVVIHAV
jgi:nucleoside-diphosphate-sugar epimerase